MSAFKEIKSDFLYDLAVSGESAWPVLVKYKEMADSAVPARLLDRWQKRFYKKIPPVFSLSPRVVNHFKLGADPEFVFLQDSNVVNADQLGLKAGLAVGADNNGRLAELRPTANKSALHVVASLYAELCFMAQYNPTWTKLTWYAAPFVGRDGLGGHIHFGRWHPARDKEVLALDNVMRMLMDAGCISETHQKHRLATNLYGKFGDIRSQAHGYEYRTFPTWIACPKQSHLYLTLAKLAVHKPELFLTYRRRSTASSRMFIKNMLAFWQDLDDDARIALQYVWGCFSPPNSDIQKAWNIVPVFGNATVKERDILPTTIAPKPAHIKAVFDHLTTSQPLKQPTELFEPLRFPEGCLPFQHILLTDRRPEVGEVMWDLAMLPIGATLRAVTSHNGAGDRSLILPKDLYHIAKRKLNGTRFMVDGEPVYISSNMEGILSVPAWLLARNIQKETKKFLTESGIFPFVRLGQALPALDNWKIKKSVEKTLLRA